MKRAVTTLALAAAVSLAASAASAQTLNTIKTRGNLNCGANGSPVRPTPTERKWRSAMTPKLFAPAIVTREEVDLSQESFAAMRAAI